MPKVAKNLSLDEDVVRRAEIYSAQNNTSVSAVVNELLSRLPLREPRPWREEDLSPAVRRLIGVAAGDVDLDDYRDYLAEKYGS